MSHLLRTKIAAAFVVAIAAIGATSGAASATSTFAHHIQLNSGDHFAGPVYYGAVQAMTVQSYGVAFSGTYVNSTSGYGGTRVSADAYCNWAGCAAQIGWIGPYPNGYPTAHHHGNASTSFFEGVVD
jgi:hypothetical protein